MPQRHCVTPFRPRRGLWPCRLERAGDPKAAPDADAPVGIVLGTGLSALAEKLQGRVVVPYADLPGFPTSSVEGHAGAFVWGRFAGACGEDDSIGRYALIQQEVPSVEGRTRRSLHGCRVIR